MYQRELYVVAFGVLRIAQDAQDCVHDVMLRLWQGGDAFRVERGSLRAFLAVCVRNEALSRARKSRNRDRIARSVREPAGQDDVGEAVTARESVRAALAGLTESQRRAIDLAYYAGLTHEQIAGELGEPVGTIKSRLSAALRRLRGDFVRQETTHAEL